MQSTIRKWGNSAAVRLPQAMLEATGLTLDAPVQLREENGTIIIESPPDEVVSLEALLAEITPDNLHGAVETGPPLGDEIL